MTQLKLSRYNVILKDFANHGDVYIYNSLTGAEVILPYEFFITLSNGGNKIHYKQNDKSDIEKLTQTGILVESQIDEIKAVKYLFNRIKYDKNSFSATILTTYDCNLTCRYCYQKGMRSQKEMSSKCTEIVFKFLANQITNNVGLKKFYLHIFGGEPLLNPFPILYLSRNLKILCKQKKIDFMCSLTTNGTLLTKELAYTLYEQGLRNIQITLDGPEKIHNERRPFKNGRGSFQTIIKNLVGLPKNLNIDLRVNIDKHNIEHISLLFDFLSTNILGKHLTIDLVLTRRIAESIGHWNKNIIKTSNEMKQYIALHYLAFKKGLHVNNRINEGLCGAQCENSITVDPFGDLYKCAGLAGYRQFKIGSVKKGIDHFRHADFVSIDPWMNCLDCPYIVLCAGGCLHQAYIEQGNICKKVCEKSFLKIALIPLLKLKYLQNIDKKRR